MSEGEKLAVIRTGGKQYLIKEGSVIRVEKLDAQEGTQVTFGEVLLVSNGEGDMKVGMPMVANASVLASVKGQGRAKKVTVMKFKPKVRYKKKQGHRQFYTQVKIEKIMETSPVPGRPLDARRFATPPS